MKTEFKNDLVSIDDLTRPDIQSIIYYAGEYSRRCPFRLRDAKQLCSNKILVNVFYEPSTRTASSFQSAMFRMGGNVIPIHGTKNTSVQKGESFEDTIRVLASYGDVMVLRHPDEGSAHRAATLVDIPVINAGDGTNEHPTQTLTDLYTLVQLPAGDSKKIAVVGDLKNGRTVHSLLKGLDKFDNFEVRTLAPDVLDLVSSPYEKLESLEEAAHWADVVYMTRVQNERMDFLKATRLDDEVFDGPPFVMTKNLMDREDFYLMHPLPRVGEIRPEVDGHEGALYFDQAANGVFVRMAILAGALRGKW